MSSLPGSVLSFAQLLVAADDPPSLYRAFELGLGEIFEHHSMVASFSFARTHGGPISTWSCPARPEHTPEWWQKNGEMHPGYRYAAEHKGVQVCRCSDLPQPDEGLESHPYYKLFMEPEGYRHAMAILVWYEDQLVGFVAINRSRAQGDFSDEERALAERVQPLIVAAYRRIASMRIAEDARFAQERLLATLPIPAIVYSVRDQNVLFHNRASKESIARWRGETAKKRPRTLRLPDDLAVACSSIPRTGTTVMSKSGGLRAVLHKMDPRSHFASDVVLIVIEDDDASPSKPSASWLRLARALSTAERDVAKLAVRGLTNAQIGRQLGKSALTVKKQLESIFSKTGVANRAELGAKMAGLSKTRRA